MVAVLYARYSTDKQTESTILDQLRRCRLHADSQGWPVKAEFTDEGISGAAFGNRPGVQNALKALQTGDVLIVMDTSRLSRSQDLAPLVTRLRYRGIRVIGVIDNFDSDSQTARMQAGLSGIMSEEFRASIAARVHSALDMRARQSKPTGGRCYGYDSTGRVIEAEAAIVREVFERAARGETNSSIVRDLNVRGVPSPGAAWSRSARRSDGKWLLTALNSMLSNERYIGRVIWNRSAWKRDPDSGRRIRIERPESEWIVTQGESIVPQANWDQVQACSQPRRLYPTRKGGGPKFLISGLLECGVCGRKMVAAGKNSSYFYCGSYKAGGPEVCTNAIGVRRDIAERVLLEPIRQQLLSDEAVEQAVGLMQHWSRQERTQTVQPADVTQIDARIARLKAQVDAGALEADDVAEMLAVLEERRRAALASAWRKAKGPSVDADAAKEHYRAAAKRFEGILSGPNVVRARHALHQLIGTVRCRPNGDHLVADLFVNVGSLLTLSTLSCKKSVDERIGSGGPLWIRSIAFKKAG